MAKMKTSGCSAKFVVRLTSEERTRLEGMIRCGKGAVREFMSNYSGTLALITWKIFFFFINSLPIYKSFQQQVPKLFVQDTIKGLCILFRPHQHLVGHG